MVLELSCLKSALPVLDAARQPYWPHLTMQFQMVLMSSDCHLVHPVIFRAGPTTVTNLAPWLLTVGATTIHREFQSDIVLGGKKVFKGQSINFPSKKNFGLPP
ncbi:hypothetical protein ACFE04_014340 [Oxalis oulophora]